MIIIGLIIYLAISYFIADKIGRNKRTGFAGTLILCLLLTPFIGYLIAEGGAQSNPRGCNWCGNIENEAEFCGLCGKDREGNLRPNFKYKS